MKNEEWGMKNAVNDKIHYQVMEIAIAYCLLPIAYCLLPIACCLLPIAYCLLPVAYCLLPIAYCLLPAPYSVTNIFDISPEMPVIFREMIYPVPAVYSPS